MSVWIESYNLPSPKGARRRFGRLEVCRGPAEGRWAVRAYVPNRLVAEKVLARWRQEYPRQAVRLLEDGEPVEDELRRQARLKRERAEREAAYFERLADEARREGKHKEARYYRRCAADFLDRL
jgi:hypothetical protein